MTTITSSQTKTKLPDGPKTPVFIQMIQAMFEKLLSLPEQLVDEPAIGTKHGKPVMLAFSYEQIESILETL